MARLLSGASPPIAILEDSCVFYQAAIDEAERDGPKSKAVIKAVLHDFSGDCSITSGQGIQNNPWKWQNK